jgi:folate-dependent tRNA-U54 methylase TrmFO/GidA
MSPREDSLKVNGIENLFCAGEKAGLLVGHTEAIVTGTLAGHNAVKYIRKEKPLLLPKSLAVGDAITYVRTQMETEEGLGYKYTFSGSIYFDRMKQKDLYTTNIKEIEKQVEASGMTGIFSQRSR